MSWVTLRDGASIFVREIGRGPQTCVLLHGFGMHSLYWAPLVAPLAHRVRFVMPDLRGFGRSHHVPFNQACVLTNYAQDLEDIAQALGLERFSLGGVSMGAYTALQYHRVVGFDAVTRYLHIDQSPQVRQGPDWPYGIFGPAHLTRMAQFEEILALAAPHLEAKTPYEALPKPLKRQFWAIAARFFEAVVHTPVQKGVARAVMSQDLLRQRVLPVEHWPAYLAVMAAYAREDYDMRPMLSSITTPVTMVVGARSDMFPAQGQLLMAKLLPDVRVELFERSGHAPLFTEPARFIRVLSRFLAS